MIRHFLNPPNWFTAASIFCGTYAMALIVAAGADPAPEVLTKACVLVVFGGIFDLLDGRVARMTNRFTEFGVQLDSIADVISFGVAPALLAWSWKLHALGPVGVLITFWWVLASSFRLARFNVNTTHDAWTLKGHSQGLTTTMGGGSLVTLVWVSNGYLRGVLNPPTWAVAAIVLWLGFLMLSSLPFRHFKDIKHNKIARRMLAIGMTLQLASAVVLDPSMLFGMGALLYLTIGIGDGLVVAVHFYRLGKRLDPDEDLDLADLFVENE